MRDTGSIDIVKKISKASEMFRKNREETFRVYDLSSVWTKTRNKLRSAKSNLHKYRVFLTNMKGLHYCIGLN